MKIRITKKGLPKAQWLNSQIEKPKIPFNFDLTETSPRNQQQAIIPFRAGYIPSDLSFPKFPAQQAKSGPQFFQSSDNLEPNNFAWQNFNNDKLPVMPFEQKGYDVNYQGSPAYNPNDYYTLTEGTDGIVNSTRGFVTKQDTDALANVPSYNKRIDELGNIINTGSKRDIKNAINQFNTDFKTSIKKPGLFGMGVKSRENMQDLSNTFNNIGKGIKFGTALGSAFTDIYKKNNKKYFTSDDLNTAVAGEDGDYVTTGSRFGEFRPNDYVVNKGMFAQYGGENQEIMKIRITKQPSMAYGGQSSYGLDLGRRSSETDMPDSMSDSYSSSISAVPRSMANIEAEGGETVYGDLDSDGMMEHMKIQGKRHSEGGVPLNVPEGSFIFSDTKKMKIKDPEILKKFGMSFKKGGYTPAVIAKKFPINKYKAILEDPNQDDVNKDTASLMIKNYNDKLSYLAMIQESIKGFPQGIPKVAQASIGQNQQQFTEAKYGGYLPKAQNGKEKRVSVWDEEEQKALQEYIKQKYNVEIPINARDADSNSQRFTLPSMQNTIKGKIGVYGDEDWTSAENMADFAKRQKKFLVENPGWDPTKKNATEKFQRWYDAERVKKGMKPYFGRGQKFQRYDDKFGEYTFSAPDIEPGQPQTPVATAPKSIPGFICQGLDASGVPIILSSPFKDEQSRAAAGAYASRQEASLHCPQGEIPPSEDTVYEPPKEVPFQYMTPDLVNIASTAFNKPKKYFPYRASVNLPTAKPTFFDPNREIAAQNEAANILAQSAALIGNPQAYMANASKLQGSLGEGVADTRGRVQNQNVGVANQFAGVNADIIGKNNMLAAQRANELGDLTTTLNQNYDNAKRNWQRDLATQYGNAWNNRMKLNLMNLAIPMFNIDPRTGKSLFTNRGYGFDMLGNRGSSNAASMNFMQLKNKLMQDGYSESLAERKADAIMSGGNASTSYTDANMDGVPDRVSTTQRGIPMNYMSSLMSMMNMFNKYGGTTYYNPFEE